MIPDRDSCWRALAANDVRFDGVFYVGVTSTRIYCRPVCRARTPRRDRCRFFTSAAAAERAGFRPCLRCRPELAPGNGSVDSVHRIATEAVRRITAGALNEADVETLARELGVGGRQLRRVVEREIGVTPVEFAQTQRLLLAKRLLADTNLPVTQIALTSGFGSVRRFNALFRTRYRLSPTALRRVLPEASRATATMNSDDVLALTLAYRPPLAWGALIAFLGARATPGVEMVDGDAYVRTITVEGHAGWVRVAPDRSRSGVLRVELAATLLPVLMPLLARLRALFDLDAAPAEVDARLAKRGLGDQVRRLPGLRLPGAVDGFELAVRAVLGQQVTVRGATTLAGRLADRFGEPITIGGATDERLGRAPGSAASSGRTSSRRVHGSAGADAPPSGLSRLAPAAVRLADASTAMLMAIGLPRARAETIRGLARASVDGTLRLETGGDPAETMRVLASLPGIGDWTAQYIAMRALHWPDAFPATDLVLRRMTGGLTPARLRDTAEGWRPWRAYAAMHLWMASAR